MKPLVSVAVPAYRHEEYIADCLNSIVAQSYEPLELILVDDASPDGTAAVADYVLSLHPDRFRRVRVVENAINRGAPYSLNRALALSKGEYVAFVNSDDRFTPDRIEKLVSAAQTADSGIAFSGVTTIDEDGAASYREALCHKVMLEPAMLCAAMPSVSWALMQFQVAVSTGNLLVRRDLAAHIGGFRPLEYCHDWDFALHLSFYTEPVMVDEPLYEYRLHGRNSFRSLTHVADSDTKAVFAAHFARVNARQPPNPLCAAPQNWPAIYDIMIEKLWLNGHQDALYAPYKPWHRTIDAETALR